MSVLHVRGAPDTSAAAWTADTGRFADLVTISGTTTLRTGDVRGAGDHAIEVADNQVVELELEGGVRLITSVGQLRETMDWSGVRGAGDELFLPSALQLGPVSRGAGRWAFRALRLLNVDLAGAATDRIVARLERRLLGSPAGADPDVTAADGVASADAATGAATGAATDAATDTATGASAAAASIAPAGRLFRCDSPLQRGALITAPDQVPTTSPVLLLLHGTASISSGSFAGLTEPGAGGAWDRLRARYGANIIAFDHPTLSVSPITNALQLVEQLPDGARLHIISHSRGGLVGELLCRGQRTDRGEPFDDAALRLFKGKAYAGQRDALQLLGERLLEKRVRVERFVRVACPARGTTLASGRLDFYLSIVFNAIGMVPALKANPVYEFMTALLAAVAKQRTDPRALPGLEAMMPVSPLIRTLNDPRVRVGADLTVIAGDTEGSGLLKTLRTFATDLFYRENHDLVVQTSSMAGGAVRDDGARFHFAKGSAVDHFHYFRNPDTAERVVRGLIRSDGSDDGFERVTDTTATELKTRAPAVVVPGARPVVFVVPGIMGSHLGRKKDRFWIDPIDIVRGRFGELDIDRGDVEAQALVGRQYDRLRSFLATSHEVVSFPYDWRRSILESADLLADAVSTKLGETNKPVRIVAHSMGGLVARAMFARRPELRDRFVERAGSRLVMLGTPNGGSHSIPRVLLGQEKVLKYLVLLDFTRSQEQLLRIVARFTGMLQLLPMSGPDDFFTSAPWHALHAAHGAGWVVPTAADLDEARRLWTLLADAPGDAKFMAYVAGRAHATPVAYRIDATRRGNDRIQFLATREGDGRVPWSTGRMDGVPTWYVAAEHGNMANHAPAFNAYHELLERGTTTLLPTQPPADVRGAATFTVMPADEADMFPDDDDLIAAALGFEPELETHEQVAPLGVSIAHGNLGYARDAIAVGHYTGDTIEGAERALDSYLCGALSERRQLDLYPGPIETAEVILRDGKPAGAIVVGLGDVGWLTPGKLERSFAHAVVRYASVIANEDACNPSQAMRSASITSLLIGSGRGGIPVADSIRAIVDGTLRARDALRGTPLESRVSIDRLEFLELYEDVAISAARSLTQLADSAAFRGRIHVNAQVRALPGGRRRAAFEEQGRWWDRLQITASDGALRFHHLTQRARTESRQVAVQSAVVDRFINSVIDHDTADVSDAGLAHTLFDLLMPNELKEYAPDRNDLVLLLDEHSARYPWELLQDRAQPGTEPIAVRAGVIRQLEEVEFREQVVAATGDGMLVVGDPPTHLPPLPGARREAEAVADACAAAGFAVTRTIGADFASILHDLYATPYRMIHLAGHGVLGTSAADAGMVIGEHAYLTTTEIDQLRQVPDVVFVNCCHIGLIDGQRQSGVHYPRLAATLARQLIRMGVRAVVAAGWAVDDAAAVTFARTFYERMLAQVPFGEAVQEARRETHAAHPTTNTWGAYQCYGDHGFVLRTGRSRSLRRASAPSFVAVRELLVELENLCQDADATSEHGLQQLRDTLGTLYAATPAAWRSRAEVRAALGRACAQLDLFAPAIRHYRALLRSGRADYTVAALEQLSNLRSRHAVQRWVRRGRPGGAAVKRLRDEVRDAIRALEALPAGPSSSATTGQPATTSQRIAGDHAGSIAHRSAERWSLIGSGWKRLSYISTGKARLTALRAAADAYASAEHAGGSFYPGLNRIACELALATVGGTESSGDLDSALSEVERAAAEADRESADFWTGVGMAEVAVVRSLVHGEAPDEADVLRQYTEAWRRGGSPQKLRSVLEQLEWLGECLKASSLDTIRERIAAHRME